MTVAGTSATATGRADDRGDRQAQGHVVLRSKGTGDSAVRLGDPRSRRLRRGGCTVPRASCGAAGTRLQSARGGAESSARDPLGAAARTRHLWLARSPFRPTLRPGFHAHGHPPRSARLLLASPSQANMNPTRQLLLWALPVFLAFHGCGSDPAGPATAPTPARPGPDPWAEALRLERRRPQPRPAGRGDRP